jgi:hypothetical protein
MTNKACTTADLTAPSAWPQPQIVTRLHPSPNGGFVFRLTFLFVGHQPSRSPRRRSWHSHALADSAKARKERTRAGKLGRWECNALSPIRNWKGE